MGRRRASTDWPTKLARSSAGLAARAVSVAQVVDPPITGHVPTWGQTSAKFRKVTFQQAEGVFQNPFAMIIVGKRYYPRSDNRLAVFLEADLAALLQQQAQKAGKDPSQLLNELLRSNLTPPVE